jgi:hypothetical protein
VSDRLAGLLLFLPVPLVLFLFTRLPLGLAGSLGLGTALMVTHRLYARPFSLARAPRRCLWCGGPAGDGPSLAVDEPLGRTTWRACRPEHGTRLGRVLAWAEDHAVWLRVGILGTLLAFLPGAILAGTGRLGAATTADAVGFFRLGIAMTVLPLGFFAAAREAAPRERSKPPFPLHIQALIGTWSVLWLFRLIGLAWLTLALTHFGRRIAAGS